MCLGFPGKIVEVRSDRADMATVSIRGMEQVVNTGMLQDGELSVGAWVVVHMGFAMSVIDETEAQATLAELSILEQAYAEEPVVISER